MNRLARKRGNGREKHTRTRARALDDTPLPDAGQTYSRFDWLLYGYFLSIVLEKSSKDRKRIKAHITKLANTA
jgi:hypothetical protein